MSAPDDLIPIGIDLGSLHARVAIGNVQHQQNQQTPSEGLVDTRPLPNIISNVQGSRYTLALVGLDKSNVVDDDNGCTKASSTDDNRHIFGEAARRALARDKKPTISKDPSSMVRELVRSYSSFAGGEGGEDGDKDGGKDEKHEMNEKASSAAAFFGHLAELACDASSSHPSKLRTVVSVPVNSTPEEQAGIVQSVERGINEALAARKSSLEEAKSKKKKKEKNNGKEDDGVVVGVVTDPAAVCVAHGLTEMESSRTIDLASPKSGTPSTWRNALVIDWGASGLTATHIRRTSPNSSLLTVVRHATDTSCSGSVIVAALVSHCASMFERKNRVSGVLDSVKAHHRLEMECESAVRTLTRAPSVTCAVDGLYDGLDMAVPISRPRFDMLVSGILRKGETLLQTFDASEFEVVLLAGNVCDMPAVQSLIRTKLFPNANAGRGDVPPDEAVAIGCARHAASVLSCPTHSKSGGKLSDGKDGVGPAQRSVPKCPVTIGICKLDRNESESEMEDIISRTAVPLIEIGEPLPANVTREITYNNGEGSWPANISLAIVQMKGGAAKSSKVIGRIDKVPAETKSLEITMELSSEGKLSLSVNGGPSGTL